MTKLPQAEDSYWMSSVPEPEYAKLQQDLEIDVAVVGGGITGLTAAYLLKQAGKKVAILEKNTIGSGVTGHTTGKVTSQHNLIYQDLQQRLGEKTARCYGEANQAALAQIKQIITKENIDCDWQRDDNYVFTSEAGKINQFKAEAETAKNLGLPASFETELPLPFEIQGAVRFANQAKLHARKYLLGLARAVHGQGSYVFEHSKVTGIRDGRPGRISTKQAAVYAKDIIVATNVPTFPLMARGTYCALEYPLTSYIVAAKLEEKLTGMYISPDSRHYSILPITAGDERLLLIGGAGHIPGLGGSAAARYQRLADYAREQFNIKAIKYRWSARDYLSYDAIPLVGKLYPWSGHTYVATAFMKWGLSNGTAAGMILSDLICGRKNAWAAVFNSNRLKPITSIPRAVASFIK